MEQAVQAVSVPIITIIVYWIIAIIKTATKNNENFNRCIPLLACVIGAICGVIAHFSAPLFLPTDNLVIAIVIGGASGLSATGTNQIIKQLGKFSKEVE